ncbi:putative UPF0481 protein At3g02645 [Corylus avellana]|uniref:putative UPF0481 protein At3g02645 n=1 Tax=Corylus avellana TaxID=13451 RepID=UPI001E21659E|nr:putative UPF0481 protein At3g02645 [Corylus avellana]
MEKSANAEIQEVIINVKSEREANSPSGNESQNEEVDGEANASIGNGHQNRELVKDITQMLESSEPPLSPKCCIYRVPLDLRNLNEEAYTPKVISIGPFHHGVERLEAMEKRKVRYFKIFVEKAKLNVENLVSIIRDREKDVRSCYSEISNLSTDDYVKMILLDASFIIVFLLKRGHEEWADCDNSTTFTERLMIAIFNDIWLLENQLPLFLIEELYSLAFPSPSNYPLFTQLAIQLCEELVTDFFSPLNEHHLSSYSNFHFLDLARTISLSQSKRLQKRSIGNKFLRTYNASQLVDAGVKFKVVSSECLFDIEFTNGVLKIPCLTLYIQTESLFRNLVALEQCHYQFDRYVTDYVYILDFLIDTNKDVDLLVEKGILVNTLGDSNAATTLVNKLSQHTYFIVMNSDYCRLCENLNTFYSVPCHKWKAILRRDYFSTPWRIASTVAAIILLVLTFIQTVRSFY